MPIVGWSRAYPETTGYIIPTLLQAGERLSDAVHRDRAIRFGQWLLSIQNADGSWNGGLHPAREPKPSVFNTGQVLKGMLALWRRTHEQRWLDAAARGTRWLAASMAADGLWKGGDYRARKTPSYYSHVLWPMLDVAVELGDESVVASVRKGVDGLLARIRPNGAIEGWAFSEGQPAFTHTIAYTIRGLQECGRLLEDPSVGNAMVPALEKLLRRSELKAGRLPGAFDEDWNPSGAFVCLTGNAQVAKCLLIWEQGQPDLRVVSGAARMVDVVCRHQRLRSASSGIRGAVAGSAPLSGPYMRFRYPNWAAKYLCDAIMALEDRLERER